MNPEPCTYKRIQPRTGNDFVVPCYYVEVIWGATAMITRLTLLSVNEK